ncbi:MAG: hypothetical protein FRX49_04330 [Trebouxia sp. A1-2]|nr:MAG: hypothetical protein FRX49_04330 [Trebouxia sp. A1-2]
MATHSQDLSASKRSPSREATAHEEAADVAEIGIQGGGWLCIQAQRLSIGDTSGEFAGQTRSLPAGTWSAVKAMLPFPPQAPCDAAGAHFQTRYFLSFDCNIDALIVALSVASLFDLLQLMMRRQRRRHT